MNYTYIERKLAKMTKERADKQVATYMTESDKRQLKAIAAKQGRTISNLVLKILREYIEQNKSK